MLHKLVLLMALSFCAGGCALFHETSGVTPAAEGSTNANGYALLFDLLGDEKDVSKLLIIKRERAELRDLIREIAQRCGKAHDELERFARADRTLNLKAHGLPPAESESRAAIGKTKAKQLLTQSGKEFELRLLIAQHEALTYGSHLAGTMVKSESNAQRGQFLRQLSSDLTALEQRVTSMLLTNYNWTTKD
jgi:hypothetical protein